MHNHLFLLIDSNICSWVLLSKVDSICIDLPFILESSLLKYDEKARIKIILYPGNIKKL